MTDSTCMDRRVLMMTTDQPPIPLFVQEELELLGIPLPDTTLDLLNRYLSMLLDVNMRVNLTGVKDRDQAWRRHVIDSLTLLPWLDQAGDQLRVIDVGSGGGLPGLPITIARPGLSVTLLEATGKKAEFLKICAAELELESVSVLNTRAELAGQDPAHRERYDLAVCRALGPTAELLEYTLPLVRPGGWLLAMKGPSLERELERAGDAMMLLGGGQVQVHEAYPPGHETHTVIMTLEKASPTPKLYPRRPGVPRQEPL